jgi:hypothetical protein
MKDRIFFAGGRIFGLFSGRKVWSGVGNTVSLWMVGQIMAGEKISLLGFPVFQVQCALLKIYFKEY